MNNMEELCKNDKAHGAVHQRGVCSKCFYAIYKPKSTRQAQGRKDGGFSALSQAMHFKIKPVRGSFNTVVGK